MMQGHASLNIGPVSVRNNTLHGGRCRQWSASYPGDLPTVVLLKARVARTAFRVSSVTVLRAAAWMARKCHRSVAYRLILSASCPTGVHAESAGARKKGASASKDKSKQKKKNSNNRPKYNHSKIATDIFKEWFYAHMHHPFPSDEMKAEFADRTGMPIATVRLLPQRRWGLSNFCFSELLHSFSIQIFQMQTLPLSARQQFQQRLPCQCGKLKLLGSDARLCDDTHGRTEFHPSLNVVYQYTEACLETSYPRKSGPRRTYWGCRTTQHS